MIKRVVIFIIIVSALVFGISITKSDTPDTVVKKYAESKGAEITQGAYKQTWDQISKQASNSACSDSSSSWCTTHKTTISLGNVLFTIIIAITSIVGFLVAAKTVIPMLFRT